MPRPASDPDFDEDDDLLARPRGRKRAAVTPDVSERDDVTGDVGERDAVTVDVGERDDVTLDVSRRDAADPDVAEADDDILQRRRRAAAPAPAATAGGDRWGARWLLVAAVVVGVAVGAYLAGRYAAPDSSSATASESAAASDADLGLTDTGLTSTDTDTAEDATARLAELADILAANPDDTDALLEQGVLLYEAGDLEGAGEAWLRVTAIDPAIAESWYNLGFYYLSTDPVDVDASRAAWEQVVALDPDSDLGTAAASHLEGLASAEVTVWPDASATPTAAAGG
ncbi:MAG: hypothetical protein LBR33_09755 [Propionibacteriaceae bacterium]|jgi:tetratricopeptide (TPR) repeat protein|nr:hypothetical protein [Propionibacteriaceae bacterium]